MMRRAVLIIAVLLVPLMAVPSANATPFPQCNPVDPSPANIWNGAAGAWSDGAHWSYGHPPTSSEDACILAPVEAAPTVDIDASVRTLVVDALVIPAGRQVSAAGVWSNSTTVDGRLSVADVAPTSIGGVHVTATGTLSTVGTVSSNALQLDSGATLDVTGQLEPSTLSAAGDLTITGTGTVSVDTAQLAGSISGPTASIHSNSLTVGQVGTHVDIDISAVVDGTLGTLGDVDLLGNVTASTLRSSGSPATIAGSLRGPNGSVTVDGAGARFDADSLIDVTDLAIEAPTSLVSCHMSGSSEVLLHARLSVADVDCLDAATGSERTVFAGSSQACDGTGQLVFDGQGILDGGGVLRVDDIDLLAGAAVNAATTELHVGGSVRSHGSSLVGAAHIDGDFRYLCASDGTLRLDQPVVPGTILSVAERGFVEVTDPAPRTASIADTDISLPGGRPIRYVTGGVEYEPERQVVQLQDATWAPTVTTNVHSLGGRGTVVGDVRALGIVASGPLRIVGDLYTEVILVGPTATRGTLDLSQARQHYPGAGPEIRLTGAVPLVWEYGHSETLVPGLSSIGIVTAPGVSVPAHTRVRISTGSGVVRVVDADAPGAVTFTGLSSSAGVVTATWSSATDSGPSGVAGYAVSFARAAGADPGQTVTTTQRTATSEPLANGTWFVQVRAIDGDGNAGPIASSGPITIAPDSTPPPVPTTPGPVIRTGSGRADRLFGGALADRLRGMGGNDVLDGRGGNDLLDGGAGNDRITCGTGLLDRALGGAGADVVSCRDGGRGRDVIDCGPGRDRAIVDRRDIVRHCEVVVRR
jgi:hypothetical protein